MSNMVMQPLNIRIDMSHFHSQIGIARSLLTADQFKQVMKHTFYDLKTRLRTPIWQAVQPDYRVSQGQFYQSMGKLHYQLGNPMSCWFHFKGFRLPINSAGASSTKKGFIYQRSGMKARIVKGAEDDLPLAGARPHYKMRGQKRVIVWKGKTRIVMEKFRYPNATDKLYPSKKMVWSNAVGISIPQMPINRSEAMVNAKVLDVASKRLIHNVQRALNG